MVSTVLSLLVVPAFYVFVDDAVRLVRRVFDRAPPGGRRNRKHYFPSTRTIRPTDGMSSTIANRR